VKGKGEMVTYLLIERKGAPRSDGAPRSGPGGDGGGGEKPGPEPAVVPPAPGRARALSAG
jgi:hypothetical protein